MNQIGPRNIRKCIIQDYAIKLFVFNKLYRFFTGGSDGDVKQVLAVHFGDLRGIELVVFHDKDAFFRLVSIRDDVIEELIQEIVVQWLQQETSRATLQRQAPVFFTRNYVNRDMPVR